MNSPLPNIQALDLTIEGMTCASCVAHVERALAKVEGVSQVSVNLATARAHIESSKVLSTEELIEKVEQAGYSAKPFESSEQNNAEKSAQEEAILTKQFTLSFIATLPLFVMEMGAHLIPAFHHWLMANLGNWNWIIQAILTSFVMFGPGKIFYQKGIPSLLRFTPDMNSLVALGSLAAWGYSLVATFLPQLLPSGTVNVYYEAAAVIITLILLGRLLEARAKGRTGEAISRLIKLQPHTANLYENGQTTIVEVKSIKIGNILLVKPGERIALDGEVIEGNSFVDESMMTGESVPVNKSTGSEVIGGTLNTNGSLIYRVSKIGKDTLLAQIINLVESAQASKLPIQAMVDQITRWFVPLVMLLAVVTFFIWLIFGPEPAIGFALVNAVAVLIIACPCAMGLATPTSIMVATGRAASMGLLFRRGDALQSLAEIKTIAFDKTGTLTEGKQRLTDFVATEAFEQDYLLSLAAAAEQHSEHPIAVALVNAAKEKNVALAHLETFSTIPGNGVVAKVAGVEILLGADRMLKTFDISVDQLSATADRLSKEGKTPIFMAVNNQLAAVMALADTVKPDTPAALKALHKLGFKIAMITGDNQKTAEAIAKELDIDLVIAEVMPEQKVDTIKQLRNQHGKIAFVGDGINDAPALAEADLGLAIGTGTDVAIESADLVLVNGSLQGVPNSIALARATMRNIKQNLFWAFAYNALLIPVAAGLAYPINGWLLSPMLAAAAMALSSVFVVTNALRLRNWQVDNA
jgi:heavy metal translocating P-type ATPase